MLPEITKWLVLLTAALWIVYDIIPIFTKEKGDTISEFVINCVTHNPIIMVAIGCLVMHLFVPAGRISHWAWKAGVDHPIFPLIVGAIVGLFFWSQVRN